MIRSENLLNLAIRASSIGIKTFFIFFAARLLEPNEYGKLSLINNGISLMLSITGLNFFNYSSRIIVQPLEAKNGLLHHFIFTSFTGIASLAFLPLLVQFGGIDSSLVVKFGLILYLEHVFTEIFRVQVPLNKIVQANVIHFFRICCSSLLPITTLWLSNGEFSLDEILETWLISLTILLIILMSLKIRFSDFEQFKFSFEFIRQGLRTAFIYLLISILGRTMFTLDKFIVNQISGPSEVGVYAFFYSMAFTIQTLIETSFISSSLPEMLKSNDIQRSYQKLIKKVILSCFILGVGLILLRDVVLAILNRSEFISGQNILYVFVLGASAYAIALTTMMPLYAKKKDKEILLGYFQAFLFFIFINVINHGSYFDIAVNMASSYGFLLLALFFQYQKLFKS